MLKFRTVLVVVFLVAVIAGGSVTYAVSPAGQYEPPTISVSGVIEYDTGFGRVPAQGLRVRLMDYDWFRMGPGDELGRTTTDENGRYSFEDIENIDYDGPENRRNGGQDVFLFIETDNDHVAVLRHTQASVYRWSSADTELLGAGGRVDDVEDGAHVEFGTIRFRDGVRDYQAISAFSVMNQGWSFVVEEMGLPDPGRTVAWWPAQTTTERGYHPDRKLIILSAGDGDFPDAILHMQAQAFMDNIYRGLDSSYEYPDQCSVNQPIDEVIDPECSWVHGFGMWFAVVAQNDVTYRTASELINVELPPAGVADGDAVAARVAGALLDLMDADNEGYDQYTGSFMEIWDTFATTPIGDFPEFWDTWVSNGLPECEPLTSLYQNTINYNTPPELDPFPNPVEMNEDPENPPAFYMPDRARDAECSFDKLLFDVEGGATSTVSVELRDDGVLEIIPAENWFGEVTVNVRVFDGVDYTSQPLHVIVHAVNDAPTILAPPDRSVYIGEEIVYQLAERINDVDDPKDSLTLSVVETQDPGVPVNIDVDQENFIVRFTPQDEGQAGLNVYEFRVTDPHGAVGRHTVFLRWELRPNGPPEISPTIPLVWEAHKGQTIEMGLLDYATDDRDKPEDLQWFVNHDEEQDQTLDNATVSGEGTQTLVFTPDPATFIGDDVITLIVQDTDGVGSKVDVTLRWTPLPNIAPFINPPLPDFRTGINQQLVVDLRGYGHDQDDNDGGLRWFVQVDPDAPVTIAGQGRQILTFTPIDVGFEGTIQAEFFVRDPKGAEDSQVVNLTWENFNTYMPLVMVPFKQKPGN